jgi:hypothetical protein
LTDAAMRRMVVNFTEEQRDFAEENFGVREWPEQFLRRAAVILSARIPPSTQTWWDTMRIILRQMRVSQMDA